jgi:cell envelope opacity-associated protein A
MKKILASLVASAFLLGAPAIAATTSKKPAAHATATKPAVAKKSTHTAQKTSAKATTKPKSTSKTASKTPSKTAAKSKTAPKSK